MKVGRNVVKFQKIELLLKVLVISSSAEGTLDSLEKNQAKRAESIRKRSLGQLTNAFHEDIHGPAVELDYEPTDLSKISMAFSFRMETDPETASAHKKKLKALVAERNRLIHHELVSVNLGSEVECRRLSESLDEQYMRVQKQMDQLQSLWKASLKMRQDLVAYMQSHEFAERIKKEQEKA